MAEELIIDSKLDRAAAYDSLIPQIASLIADEHDWIANLANVCAAIHSTFQFFWVGFYRVIDQTLVLGPFQGPIACTRISAHQGVCGTAWSANKPIRVDDVDAFPGHIACSSESRSEIVIPISIDGQVVAVLDIDSHRLSDFSQIDEQALVRISALLSDRYPFNASNES